MDSTATDANPLSREELLVELQALQAKLHELQGESPLILPSVDYQAVASVVGDWTGHSSGADGEK
jgi:type VI secretion system protein VasG